jgi:hypothetical protein
MCTTAFTIAHCDRDHSDLLDGDGGSHAELHELGAGDQRLTRVLSNTNATDHEVIDLRPLRRLARRGLRDGTPIGS